MPRIDENWHRNVSTTPGYIREEDVKKYGDRFNGGEVRGFIPNPNKKRVELTEEQALYGMAGRPEHIAPGKRAVPKRKDAGTVRPNDEIRPMGSG